MSSGPPRSGGSANGRGGEHWARGHLYCGCLGGALPGGSTTRALQCGRLHLDSELRPRWLRLLHMAWVRSLGAAGLPPLLLRRPADKVPRLWGDCCHL